MREQIFLNHGAITVYVHTKLKNVLSNSKSKKAVINLPLIHATLIINLTNVTVGNKIRASFVEQRIISSYIV